MKTTALPLHALAAACLSLLAACNSPSAGTSPSPALSASPPAASAPPSASALAEAGRDLLARARRCLASPQCSAAEAESLYRSADDAGAAGVSCFDFYYGIGIARDLPRARACFERKARDDKGCGGASPQLDRLYLAAMLVDAQGGDADPARATALFADCFADASVGGIRDEARKRASLAPSRAPLDFCKDIGGTTLTMGACHGIDAERSTAAKRRVERELGPRLDAESKQLADRARDLWSAFARLEGEAYSDKYRGGTLRQNAWAGHENELEQQRLEALAQLFDYRPAGGDPRVAERDLEKAYRAAASGDADHQRLFAAAREAWKEYRGAEVALYLRLFGAQHGERPVQRDVTAMLARRYQALLEQAVKP